MILLAVLKGSEVKEGHLAGRLHPQVEPLTVTTSRQIMQRLIQCWASVCDDGPTLNQPCTSILQSWFFSSISIQGVSSGFRWWYFSWAAIWIYVPSSFVLSHGPTIQRFGSRKTSKCHLALIHVTHAAARYSVIKARCRQECDGIDQIDLIRGSLGRPC